MPRSETIKALLFFSVAPLILVVCTLSVDARGGDRPRIVVPRISEAPEIDGDLREEIWSRAARIDRVTQVEPVEGVPGDPVTEILVMRDDAFVYVAFVCHEPDVGSLVLNDMHREGFQMEDDAVKITFDTFCDGKSGYYFLVSAAGSRLDALVGDNGQRRNYSWDGFWQARTLICSDRWTAEFAIPFKTISFGADGIWRANFERWRGVDRSRYRWTGWEREYTVTTMSEAGELAGMGGIHQGIGVEFRPYLKVRRSRRNEPRSIHTVGDVGGEISWQITPRLNTSITFNTDFAETEADARRVNLTRFSLFFPEKRDFFLQDATYFDFGWGSEFGGASDVVPYFSRRIGLHAGTEVPIEFGARVAGRVGNFDLGMLAVSTGADTTAGAPDGELVVARPAFRVNEELTVGGLLTCGNPGSDGSNVVTGTDLRFVSTDRLPGLFTLNAFLLSSADDDTDELGQAYGIKSSLTTSDWDYSLESLYTQDRFHPALGFVRRPGERRYAGGISWEPRPENGAIRNYGFSIRPSAWSDPDGTFVTRALTTEFFRAEWHSGDRFYLNHTVEGDRVDEEFEPVAGSIIAVNDYSWQTAGTGFVFSRTRPLSGHITYEAGGWYDGRRQVFDVSGVWSPSACLEFNLRYVENRVSLPGGNFATRVETLNVNFDFTPDIRLATLVQADNLTDNIGLQSRFRWIHADGRELFFVVNSSWLQTGEDAIVSVEQDFTVKIVYAVRF